MISAEDDCFGTAATAKDIAATVPGAKLILFPTGGRIWLGHDEEVARLIADFVSEKS